VTVSSVSAVGSGLPFLVAETQIAGAKPHVLVANSMDLTYHSCVDFTQSSDSGSPDTSGCRPSMLHAQTGQPGNIDGNELYFAYLDDVTHQYPNGTNNPAGFNLPDWVWPFFVLHPRP
jgi:hypothetical protein